jgi:hypothetical protein
MRRLTKEVEGRTHRRKCVEGSQREAKNEPIDQIGSTNKRREGRGLMDQDEKRKRNTKIFRALFLLARLLRLDLTRLAAAILQLRLTRHALFLRPLCESLECLVDRRMTQVIDVRRSHGMATRALPDNDTRRRVARSITPIRLLLLLLPRIGTGLRSECELTLREMRVDAGLTERDTAAHGRDWLVQHVHAGR